MTRKGRYWGRGGALKPGLEHIRDIGEMGEDIEHTEEIKADIEAHGGPKNYEISMKFYKGILEKKE